MHIKKQAFSLVELSIVLVILGLLTGGILAGQSLIRAAELRSVSTEFQRYVTAANTFRDKYFALPGDMTNATDVWGVANSTPATCVTTASSDIKTCNGNGDGHIIPSTGSNESYRFWQQLSNADLIEGHYDGITHGSTPYSSTADNSPKSKLGSGYWFVWYRGTVSGNATLFDSNYGNVLELGGLRSNDSPHEPLLKPEEAWNIDTKLDDGKPATGKVVIDAPITSCTDGSDSTSSNASYALDNSSVVCNLTMQQVF